MNILTSTNRQGRRPFLRNRLTRLTAGLLTLALIITGGFFINQQPAHAAGACTVSTFAGFAACWTANTAQTDIDITVTADITMTGTVTIPAGKNVTLTSDSTTRTLTRAAIFVGHLFTLNNATANSLTTSNIILDGNGTAQATTGALLYVGNAADSLTVNSGTVLQNNIRTSGSGGAIAFGGDTLTVDNAVIKNNSSSPSNAGGGISAILTTGLTVIITGNTEIKNNTAGTNGGGLLVGNNSTVTISGNVKIDNNEAGQHGGGIMVGASSTLSMTGGSVSNNKASRTASGNGGGLFMNNSTAATGRGALTLSNVSIDSNTAVSSANDSGGGGGGVYAGGYTDTIICNASEISNNTSWQNGAGVFSGDNTTIIIRDTVSINHNEVKNNSGGGVNARNNSVLAIADDVKITDNLANGPNTSSSGGGIVAFGQLLVSGNVEISRNHANKNGGGILLYPETATATISGNAKITDNEAGINGGGIWVDYGDLAKLDIDTSVVFSGNSAAEYDATVAPVDLPLYNSNILVPNGAWSTYAGGTFLRGYNNYDISYAATKFTVTFDPAGGSAVSEQVIYHGDTVEPVLTARDGWRLLGWFYNDVVCTPNGELDDPETDDVDESVTCVDNWVLYDFAAPVTANMTLAARWEETDAPSVPDTSTNYAAVFDSLTKSSTGYLLAGLVLVVIATGVLLGRRVANSKK